MNPKKAISDESNNIITAKYEREPIYKLWSAFNSVDEEISQIISTNNHKYYNYLYDPLEEALVIIDLIKPKSFEVKWSFLEYLRETKEYLLSKGNIKKAEDYSKQIAIFQKTFI